MSLAKNKIDYTLYLVTDRQILKGRNFLAAVEEALQAGVTLLQLREKEISSLDFYQLALQLKELTRAYEVPLIINDRLDIALAIDADGLHIGQEDIPVAVARRLLGPDKILGYSVSNLEEARRGVAAEADYLGAGAVFPTGSKADAGNPIGLALLKSIKAETSLPVVGIGGINSSNVATVKGTGVKGVSVISAILGQKDIGGSTKELRQRWLEA